jgi:5-methylcytosine-specific restriction endonuclease McrA
MRKSGSWPKQNPEVRKRYDTSEKGQAAKKRYRGTEKRRAAALKYTKTEKGKQAAFRANHSEKYRIARQRFDKTPKGRACAIRNSHAHRARKYNSTTVLYSYSERQRRFAMFGNTCAYCGTAGPLTEDHFVSLKQGGVHALANIVPCCRTCNVKKNAKDPEQWYRKQPFFSEQRWAKLMEAVQWISVS